MSTNGRSLAGLIVFAVLLLGVSQSAFAETVCVYVNEESDTLSPEDRSAALTVLRQKFRSNGVIVVDEGCDSAYLVTHVELGQSIIVSLERPDRALDHRASSIEELPEVYDQLVIAMLTGRELEQSIQRDNVTERQENPRRVGAEGLTYARVGYGLVGGDAGAGGPSFGLGGRWELDQVGFDFSIANLTIVDGDIGGVGGSLMRIQVFPFINPSGNTSGYAGGGFGLSVSAPCKEFEFDVGDVTSRCYRHWGMSGELVVGAEFLRASNARVFVQLDASLPFGKARLPDDAGTATRQALPDSFWSPVFQLTLGVGG